MNYFLQQLINGLTLGAMYGLIAIGYSMVYGIIGMINFAHGEIYMIGAFLSVIVFTLLAMTGITAVPLALLTVLIVAMLITAAYGWTVERIAYRPLRGSFRLAPLISAIGMSIFLQNYVQIVQGANVKPLPPIITGGFVMGAESGEEGLKQIEAQQPDLVLVDFAMPGLNGADVARAARKLHPDLPIIFVTGYAETEQLESALGSDVPVLRKPFSIAQLGDAVERQLPAEIDSAPALESENSAS